MILLLPIAAPIPLDYTLPEPAPVVQTVEEPVEADPAAEDSELYRIGKDKWTTDKAVADRMKRAKVRRVLYHTLNAADLATTIVCIEAPNCKEANPLYGQSIERAVAGKVLSAALFEVFRSKDGGGEVGEWIAIGLLTAVVGNNLTVVF